MTKKLTPDQITLRDKKKGDISEKISARKTIRQRIIDNHQADLDRIDAEIASLQMSSDALDQLQ